MREVDINFHGDDYQHFLHVGWFLVSGGFAPRRPPVLPLNFDFRP